MQDPVPDETSAPDERSVPDGSAARNDHAVLTEELKATIQTAYREWLSAKGYGARRGQRQMIAAVARTLSGDAPRILAVEAGTGTGKTAAYCLAAIPLAQALGKTVVISTATVALQEQVVFKDLPDLRAHTGLPFDFVLAKGRGRYVCLKRLDDQLRQAAGGVTPPLFEDADGAGGDFTHLYQRMLDAFAEKRWDGELDSWSDADGDARALAEAWRGVTTDHRGCSNNRCSFFRQCPFFRARAQLAETSVIVANHDLVLADLSLGGGIVLPEPEDCVYVLDEAHHLAGKTQRHFSVSLYVRGTESWCDQVQSAVGTMTQRFGRPEELVRVAANLGERIAPIGNVLERLDQALQDVAFTERDDELATARFAHGDVPGELQTLCAELCEPAQAIGRDLETVHGMLREVIDGTRSWSATEDAEDWLPIVGQLQSRLAALHGLVDDYAAADDRGEVVRARWVNRYAADYQLVSAPLRPGALLHEVLWDRCYAALLTSATLTAMGRFDRFLDMVGLADVVTERIPSPFDFQRIATLDVPDMASDPRDFDAHCAEIAQTLPDLVRDDPGALVLFTSWRQKRRVVDLLPRAFLDTVLQQGDDSKQALLAGHRKAVDSGAQSRLFGLASFAEGVDLPDDYCRHVVLCKLPFAVPDDPLDQAMAEWVEQRHRNAFFEISVPDAALRLVQACGRLIRHENDYGRITILDRRLRTARYASALLDSLPPYRRVFNGA